MEKKTLLLDAVTIYDVISTLFSDEYIQFGETPVSVTVDMFTHFRREGGDYNYFSWKNVKKEVVADYFKEKFKEWAVRGTAYGDVYGIRFVDFDGDPDYFQVSVIINGFHAPKIGKVTINERA